MIRVFKRMFKILILLLIFALIFSVAFIWYNFYDVTGLTLYKDEKISNIVPYYDRIYVITDDGKGYVAGNYNSTSRKYRNSESYHNDKLGTPSPVMFYDGVITKINPYSGGAVFINDSGSVFDFNEFPAQKVYDNASYAIKASYKQGRKLFGESNKELYYIIDTADTLYALDGEGRTKECFREVSSVNYYLDTLLVLYKNGDLNQYTISDNGEFALKETLFKNVQSFDIEDTSLRYDGKKLIFDDEVAKSTPLINVLTNDGEVYAIGAYNLLCCTRSLEAHAEPKTISEWTLIAQDAENFSLAPMGTVIKYRNGTVGYYGFDTDNSSDSEFKFGYIDLNLTNVIDVYASDVQVLVKTEQAFYVWGYSLIFDIDNCEHNLFTDAPIVIKP